MAEVHNSAERLQLGDKSMIEQGDEILLKINELKKAKEQSKSRYEQEQLGYEILTLARRFNNTKLDEMKARAQNELNALKSEGKEGGELGQLLNKFLGETEALKSALESARKAESSATKEKWYKIFAPQEAMVREVVGDEPKPQETKVPSDKVVVQSPKESGKEGEEDKAKQEVLKLLKDGVTIADEAGYKKFAAHAEKGGLKMPEWSALPAEVKNSNGKDTILTMSFEGTQVNVYSGKIEGEEGNKYVRRSGTIEAGKFTEVGSIKRAILPVDLLDGKQKNAVDLPAIEKAPAVTTAKPVEATTKPVEATTKPVEATTKPVEVAKTPAESPEAKKEREAIAFNDKYNPKSLETIRGKLGLGQDISNKMLVEKVIAFQKKNKLTDDGKIGNNTLGKLGLEKVEDKNSGFWLVKEKTPSKVTYTEAEQKADFEREARRHEAYGVGGTKPAEAPKPQPKRPLVGVDTTLTPAQLAAQKKAKQDK